MKVFITNTFKRAAKKVSRDQITTIEETIKKIQTNPNIGELKVGDLAGVRVYKFRMTHQLVLLVYTYDDAKKEITLLAFASHENFYKKLKK